MPSGRKNTLNPHGQQRGGMGGVEGTDPATASPAPDPARRRPSAEPVGGRSEGPPIREGQGSNLWSEPQGHDPPAPLNGPVQRQPSAQSEESASPAGERRSLNTRHQAISRPGAVSVPGLGRTRLRRQANAPVASLDGSSNGGATEGEESHSAVITEATLVIEPPVYEARRVVEVEEDGVDDRAHDARDDSNQEEQCFSVIFFGRRFRQRQVLGLLVVVAAAIVGLAVGLTRKPQSKENNRSGIAQENAAFLPTVAPTPATAFLPTDASTPAPKSDPRADAITQLIFNVSGDAAVQESTPQNQALSWLVHDDPLQLDASNPRLLQRYVLMLLFLALNGEDWYDKSGYGSGANECDWFAVTCNVDGFVEKYNNFHNNLGGSGIPEEISELSSLTSLYMSENRLEGTMPSSIGKLHKLKYLALYENLLTGSIPSHISSLIDLKSLNLKRNQLTGSIPEEIGDLNALRFLSLVSNDLIGSIPMSLLGLGASLEELRLSVNQLSGSIPSDIGNLRRLKKVYLWHNRLTSTIPSELGRLLELKNMLLHDNYLNGTIPSTLGSLTQLEGLQLHWNNLTGTMPEPVCNLQVMYDTRLSADCKGPTPEVQCLESSCCTDCCDNTEPKAIMLGKLC